MRRLHWRFWKTAVWNLGPAATPGTAEASKAPTSATLMLQMSFRVLGAASSRRRLEARYSREERAMGQTGAVLGDTHG